MADVRIDVEKVIPGGLAATYTGSLLTTNDYLIKNDGKTILHFKKSAAVNAVITVETPITVDGLAVAERTATVPASTGDRFMGPFPTRVYNDTSGDLRFTPSDVDGLTVAVLRI